MNQRKKHKNYIINGIVVLIVIAISIYVGIYTLHFGNVEYTDNAQVKKLVIPVHGRVKGYIREIRFEEFQPVSKGDTLIIIEDMEYRLQLAQSEADYQQVLADKFATYTSLQTARNNVFVSDASIEEARIKMENTLTEYNRYKALLQKDAVTREQYDNVKAGKDMAKARYEMLLHQKQSALLIKDEHGHHADQSGAFLKLAEAKADMARLNLSYTVITAPCNGVTGRKNIQEGQFIQAGQTLVDLVDNCEIWVTAYYKESQIARIHKGQAVDLKVDAFPETTFKGIVKSISDATGASFSIIPQDNSTGNFVKVQQRIPVRIEFTDENMPGYMECLRAGMNVECLVNY